MPRSSASLCIPIQSTWLSGIYFYIWLLTRHNMTEFTQAQIATWVAYEAVRAEGDYNMFDPRARQLTGLTKDEYTFVMTNFSALKAAATKQEAV